MKKTLLFLTKCVRPNFLLFVLSFVVSSNYAQVSNDIRSKYNTAAGSIGASGSNWESYNSATGLWTAISTNPSLVAAGNTCTIREGVSQSSNGNTTLVCKMVIGEGNAATATASISGGAIINVNITNVGKLVVLPSIVFVSSVATTTAVASVTSYIVSDYEFTTFGVGYTTDPTVTIGTVWAANASVIVNTQRSNGGNLYTCTGAGTTAPSGGPTGTSTGISDGTATWNYVGIAATATATANVGTGNLASVNITNAGSGYNGFPSIAFTGGGFTTAATARCKLGVQAITISTSGAGYTVAPTIILGSSFQVGNTLTARTVTMNGGLEFKTGASLFTGTAIENLVMGSDLTLATDINVFSPQISTTTASTTITCTKASGTVNIIGPGKLFAKAFNVSSATILNMGSNASLIIATSSKLIATGSIINTGNITIQSTTSASGSLTNNSGSTISNVTLQQWATGQRGYRILSNPFNSALTPSTIGTANGIIITGANDVKTYNGIANVWSGSVSSIAANTPYSVFIRGLASDLTAGSGSGLVYNAGPTAFAYSVTGTLNTSPVTITQNNTTVNDWTIAGNPFAAPINSSALTGGTVGTPYYVYSMAQNNTGTQVKAGGWVAAGANSSITTPIPMLNQHLR